MSKLTGDQIREAIDAVTSGAVENKRNFIETIELQIGLRNSDPQKDKRFSGSVKLPHIPRPKMKVCMLGDAQEMGSDTVDLEVEKLLDSDDDHSIEDGDVIINLDDVMELDELVASPRCFTSGIDREFENIDISKYHLMILKFEDKSKKRDEDEFGREEEDVGNDEKIEEYTKRQFGNAFVASKDVFRQEKKQKRF